MRPPPMAPGVGVRPDSYWSSFAALYRFGPMTALAARPAPARSAAITIITTIGTYGFTVVSFPSLCRRRDLHEGGEELVCPRAAARLVDVCQQSRDKFHDERT